MEIFQNIYPLLKYGVVVLMLLGIFWILNRNSDATNSRNSRAKQQDVIGEQQIFGDSDFKQFVERSDVRQLLGYLDSLGTDESQPMPVRLSNLGQKLSIADKVLQLIKIKEQPGEQNLLEGWQAKIEALIERHVILMEMGALTEEINTALKSTISQLTSEQIEELAPHLESAIALVSLIDLQGLFSVDEQSLSEVSNKFDLAAKASKNNFWLFKQLYVVVRIYSQSNARIARPLAQQLLNYLPSSASSEVLAIKQSLTKILIGEDNKLVEFADSSKSEIPRLVEQLIQQIETVLRQGAVSEIFVEQVVDRVNELISLNQLEPAKSIVDLFVQEQSSLNSDQRSQLDSLRQQLAMFGEKLDLSALANFDGHSAEPQNKIERVVFITNRNADSGIIGRSVELQRLLRKSVDKKLVELLFVFVNSGGSEDDKILQGIRTMARQMPVAKVRVLESSKNPEISQSMFLQKNHYLLVVLDKDGNVQMLNPALNEIEIMVANLLNSKPK